MNNNFINLQRDAFGPDSEMGQKWNDIPVKKNQNSIFTIHPYLHNGVQWVFDEPRVGLDKEAFVAGADDLCDYMCEKAQHSPIKGFTAIFSDIPFPGHKIVLGFKETVDEGKGGTTFWCSTLGLKVWLCPAMLLFFPTPPLFIYIDFK